MVFGLGKPDKFRPNCRSDDEEGTIVCIPELVISGGDRLVPPRPMKFLIDKDTRKVKMVDDGGADQVLIDKTFNHLDKRILK